MSGPLDSELAPKFRVSMPGAPEGACPPAEVLWSAARGELPSGELEALATHLRTCALCGEALAISADLVPESESRVLRLARRRQLGVAAAGITALAAGLLVVLWQRGSSSVERPGVPVVVASRGGAADGAAIRAVSKEEQPASDIRLEWTPVEQALRYRVQVSSEDLQPLHDQTVEQQTTLRVPPVVGERASGRPGVGGSGEVRPGDRGVLHWQVDAIMPGGATVSSPTFTLRVAQSPAGPPLEPGSAALVKAAFSPAMSASPSSSSPSAAR
jgi:hypothetical protein